jgi:hypothetical protein
MNHLHQATAANVNIQQPEKENERREKAIKTVMRSRRFAAYSTVNRTARQVALEERTCPKQVINRCPLHKLVKERRDHALGFPRTDAIFHFLFHTVLSSSSSSFCVLSERIESALPHSCRKYSRENRRERKFSR